MSPYVITLFKGGKKKKMSPWRQTSNRSKDRATQSVDTVRLSFAIYRKYTYTYLYLSTLHIHCIWRVTGILAIVEQILQWVRKYGGWPMYLEIHIVLEASLQLDLAYGGRRLNLGWKSTDCIVQWVGQEYMEGGRYTRGAVAPLARHCPGLGN